MTATAPGRAPLRQIRSFDGLRGIAALLVVFYHFTPSRSGATAPGRALDRCALMVDLFFVLSGFVMALTYGGLFAERMTAGAIRTFLARRLARIYPLYLVVTIGIAVLVATGHSDRAPRASLGPVALANLLLVQSWIGLPSLDFPSWSISTEWAAYLLFPVLVVLLLRRAPAQRVAVAPKARRFIVPKARRFVLPKARRFVLPQARGFTVPQARILVVTFGALALTGLVELDPFLSPVTAGRGGAEPIAAAIGAVVQCLADFTLGIVAYRICLTAAGARLGSGAATVPLLLVIAALFAAPRGGGPSALIVALFPLLLLSLAADRGPVAAALGSRSAGRLGAWSYAVYLLHPALIGPRLRLAALLERHRVPEPALLATIVAVLLLLPLSALAYRFVELPARRFVRSQSWRDAVAFERSGAR